MRKTHKGEEVMFDAREILEDEHVTGDGLGHRETPSLAPSDSFHAASGEEDGNGDGDGHGDGQGDADGNGDGDADGH